MKIYKGYIRNHVRLEGCIAQCYLVEEYMNFYSGFLSQNVELSYPECQNEDFSSDMILEGRPILGETSNTLSNEVLDSAHRYVLFNTTIVEPYLE